MGVGSDWLGRWKPSLLSELADLAAFFKTSTAWYVASKRNLPSNKNLSHILMDGENLELRGVVSPRNFD